MDMLTELADVEDGSEDDWVEWVSFHETFEWVLNNYFESKDDDEDWDAEIIAAGLVCFGDSVNCLAVARGWFNTNRLSPMCNTVS